MLILVIRGEKRKKFSSLNLDYFWSRRLSNAVSPRNFVSNEIEKVGLFHWEAKVNVLNMHVLRPPLPPDSARFGLQILTENVTKGSEESESHLRICVWPEPKQDSSSLRPPADRCYSFTIEERSCQLKYLAIFCGLCSLLIRLIRL